MSRVIVLGAGGIIMSCRDIMRANYEIEARALQNKFDEMNFPVDARFERENQAWQEKPNRNAGFARAKRAAKKRGRAR